MKKILIIFWSIFFSYDVLSSEFNNKKEYTIKNEIISNVPDIMEFFSFFCPYCYEFEKIHHTRNLITKNTIKKYKNFQTYHVNFFGGKLSNILTKSWIMAQEIGVEEKIILPIFKAVQKTHTINNVNSIKKIFKKEAGINENTFNNFWNSLTIKILVEKANKEVKKSNLDHVPTMLIKGKYIIDYFTLEKMFKNNFSQKYTELIEYLVKK